MPDDLIGAFGESQLVDDGLQKECRRCHRILYYKKIRDDGMCISCAGSPNGILFDKAKLTL